MKRLTALFGTLLVLAWTSAVSAQDYHLLLRPSEVVLQPGTGIQFHAQLFASDGAAVAGATIRWRVHPEELGQITEDGFFIAGRRPGQGRVIAVAEFSGAEYVASAHVTVGAPPPPKLAVKVKPSRTVVAPGDTQRFRVRVVDADGNKVPARFVRWQLDPDRLGFIDPSGLFHAAQHVGQGELTAVVEVNGRLLRGSAQIIVSPPPKSAILGTVTTEDGTPLAGAKVIAYRIGAIQWKRGAETDENGNYELNHLLPGIYVLFARAEGYIGEYYDDAQLLREATPVQVGVEDTLTGYDFALMLGGRILGTVASEDGEILPGAHVVAQMVVKPDFKAHAVTDENGNYVIDGLPTSNYWVWAKKSGYAREYWQEASTKQDADIVSVEAPNDVPDINFTLPLRSAITGRITDHQSGEGLEGAVVFAVRISSAGTPGSHFRMTRSKADGYYTLDVPAGTYIVGAVAEWYRPVFYDGKLDPRQADLVTVQQDQHTEGIDIALIHFGTIAGTVTDENTGQPIAGARVTAIRVSFLMPAVHWPMREVPSELKDLPGFNWHRGPYAHGLRFETETDENGNYRFPGLPAGRYYVQASAQGYMAEFYDGVTNIRDATPVAVRDEQVTEPIDFALGEGGAIAGTVTSEEDGSPIPHACVVLYRKGFGEFRKTRTDESGAFRFAGLRPGIYYLAADAKGYKGEFYDNARRMRDATPIQLGLGESVTDINIALAPRDANLGAIAGVVVSDEDGSPIEGAWVYALPLRRGHIRWAVTDADGEYEITGLPSGSYFVMAWARGYVAEFYDDARRLRKATPVQVNAPSTTSDINFSLRPRKRGAYQLAGRVLDAQGQPVEGALVVAESDTAEVASVPTDGMGNFVLADLPDGRYRLRVSLPEAGDVYYGGEDSSQASALELSESSPSEEVEIQLGVTTGVSGSTESTLPAQFELGQNYPNPFNPSTEIRFALPKDAEVTLTIFNLRGQVVRTLVKGAKVAGFHTVSWDGRDELGHDVASGVYIYRIVARSADGSRFEQVRKMSLIR